MALFAAVFSFLIALLNQQEIAPSNAPWDTVTFDLCAKGAITNHFTSGINEERCFSDYPHLFNRK